MKTKKRRVMILRVRDNGGAGGSRERLFVIRGVVPLHDLCCCCFLGSSSSDDDDDDDEGMSAAAFLKKKEGAGEARGKFLKKIEVRAER